jgi:hypothetical protein
MSTGICQDALHLRHVPPGTKVDRGGGMVYDTTRNITRLANMNYASTSGYAAANAGGAGSNTNAPDVNTGRGAATMWANKPVYGGFDDWRLPTLNPALK